MGVMYTVLPPLPDGVDTVDVTLGFAAVVTGVPVADGLLEPTVEGPVVPLGTGWPEVPTERRSRPSSRPCTGRCPRTSPRSPSPCPAWSASPTYRWLLLPDRPAA